MIDIYILGDMAKLTNEEKVSEKIAFLKKNCNLCKGRSRLRSSEPERLTAKKCLENMVDFYRDQFNGLRREDAEIVDINNAMDNKRLCMDLLEECEACDKEIDRVNRGLNKIKR